MGPPVEAVHRFREGGKKKLFQSMKVRYEKGSISGICVGNYQDKLI
jgi:hypothetical protein